MNLLNINLKPIYPTYYVYNKTSYIQNRHVLLNEPHYDTFVNTDKKVSFCGKTDNNNKVNEFKVRFPKSFFKKLVKEGVPCAYTGIILIPTDDYESLKKSQLLQKRSSVAIKKLKPYKNSMYPIERQIFEILENESKKHPDLKLQEILELLYARSEKVLISKQAATLNEINVIARGLPKDDFLKVRKYINDSFDKIFMPNPEPEERFRRRDFIIGLSEIEITNEGIKNKMLKTAEKLPQSSTSVHAFIVKYAQPYKIKYINGERQIILRKPDELGLRLLEPSIATDEHIYPHCLFKAEDEARKNNKKYAKDLSSLKVTILTSQYINNKKRDTFIDDFIKTNKYDIKANIQRHINRLIEIDERWLKKGNIKDSAQLADYIIVLKEEFERRSELVKIDTSKLEKLLKRIKIAQQQAENLNNYDSRGKSSNLSPFSNPYFKHRKTQKHSPRYSK